MKIKIAVVVLSVGACDAGTSPSDGPQSGPPYPIHVYVMGEVRPDLMAALSSAAEEWGRFLAPSPRAAFEMRTEAACYGGTPSFSAGDVLAPGLHVYVQQVNDPQIDAVAWAIPCADVHKAGTSRVPMLPVGILTFNTAKFIQPISNRLRRSALHEISHLLGIGTSRRWREALRRTDDGAFYLADPRAIAVLDRMAEGAFPEETAKVPLADAAHWDACIGFHDVVAPSSSLHDEVTELTLSALATGYEYDASHIARPRGSPGTTTQTDEHGNTRSYSNRIDYRKLEPTTWNWGRCSSGRTKR